MEGRRPLPGAEKVGTLLPPNQAGLSMPLGAQESPAGPCSPPPRSVTVKMLAPSFTSSCECVWSEKLVCALQILKTRALTFSVSGSNEPCPLGCAETKPQRNLRDCLGADLLPSGKTETH